MHAHLHRPRLALLYTHIHTHTHVHAIILRYRNPSQRRNCRSTRQRQHDRCHLTVSVICRFNVWMRACARTGSPQCTTPARRHLYSFFLSSSSLPGIFSCALFALSACLSSIYSFLSFFPSVSILLLLHIFRSVRLLSYLCEICFFGSPLSGLGGSHVPWLRRGRITLTC